MSLNSFVAIVSIAMAFLHVVHCKISFYLKFLQIAVLHCPNFEFVVGDTLACSGN